MARDPNRNAHVSQVLYRVLIHEKRHKVDAVAAHLDVGPTTVYGWCINAATLPAWAVPAIYDATQDVELFRELTGAADRNMRVDAPAAEAQAATPSITEAALAAGAEAGDVLREVHDLGRDGAYDAADKAKIAKQIDEAEARLAELRQQLGLRSVQ